MGFYTFEIPEEIVGFIKEELKTDPETFFREKLAEIMPKYKEKVIIQAKQDYEAIASGVVNEVSNRIKINRVPDAKVKAVAAAIIK